jgi:hypothetical protein
MLTTQTDRSIRYSNWNSGRCAVYQAEDNVAPICIKDKSFIKHFIIIIIIMYYLIMNVFIIFFVLTALIL